MNKSKNIRSHGRKGQPVTKTRKEIRKEKREAKKQHRRDYYARRGKVSQPNLFSHERSGTKADSNDNLCQRNLSEGYVRPAHKLGSEGEQKGKYGRSDCGNPVFNKKPKSHVKPSTKSVYEDPLVTRKKEEEMAHKKLEDAMRKTRNQHLNEANDEEEKLIKKLEKQLKLSKRKSKSVPKSFVADGLDYLLDLCDSDKIKQVASIEKTFDSSDSDLEEDLALVSSKKDTMSHNKPSDSLIIQRGPSDNNKKSDGSNSSEGVASGISVNESDDLFESTESETFNQDVNDSDNDDNYEQSCCSEEDCVTNSWESNGSARSVSKRVRDVSVDNGTGSFESKERKRVRFVEDDIDDYSSKSKLLASCGKKPSKKMKVYQETKRKIDAMDSLLPTAKKLKVTKDKFDEPGRYVRKYDSDETNSPSDDGEYYNDEMFLPKILCEMEKEEDRSSMEEDIFRRNRDKPGNVVQTVNLGTMHKMAVTEESGECEKSGIIHEEELEESTSQHSAYVPPSQRTSTSAEGTSNASQQRIWQLRRRIKGLLNRLSERNFCSISKEISELYHDIAYSRNDMNTTLTTSLMESLVTSVLSLERLVMEHIALVAYLHYQEGSEIGAFILQTVVKKFDTLLKSNPDIENKELDNVVLILCYFYHFKVVHARLLFDMISCLADRFGPKDVELILLMLRSVGFGLRKDDPSRIKSVMVQLQELANSSLQKCNEPRIKFMLEVLAAVKNNNMARLPGWDPTPVDNMRKLLRTLPSHQSSVSSELNISLKDILAADERGRWWVIGSAWVGQGPNESEQSATKATPTYSAELLNLAEKMRMNTAIRRNIFCILMSSQDCNEAAANILQMGLKGIQANDIIHVTLDCCLQEKTYNQFYSFLLQILCEHNRIFQMTLQKDFWNKFDDLDSLMPTQFTNMVKLLHQLLNLEVISLFVFKVLTFTRLEKPTVRLLRQVLLGVLSGDQEICSNVFLSVTKNPKHKKFCQSLHLFLQKYVLSRMSPDDPQKLFLQERVNNMFLMTSDL